MSQENVEIVQEFVGCVVIVQDGTRVLTHAVPDPLAQQKPD
jgi:hypothetical protein